MAMTPLRCAVQTSSGRPLSRPARHIELRRRSPSVRHIQHIIGHSQKLPAFWSCSVQKSLKRIMAAIWLIIEYVPQRLRLRCAHNIRFQPRELRLRAPVLRSSLPSILIWVGSRVWRAHVAEIALHRAAWCDVRRVPALGLDCGLGPVRRGSSC